MAEKQPKTMLKTRTYLQPNRNSLQKPVEDLPAMAPSTTKNKGEKAEENNRSIPTNSTHTKSRTKLDGDF